MDLNENSTIKVNKLQGEYLSSKINNVWTVDVTSIKQKYYFFFILNLASRRVVSYDVSNHDYTSTEAAYVLYKALREENSVIPHKSVKFMHTDSGGIFLSEEWKETLKVNNIEASSADSKRNQNQVSERFNRTFKKLLRDFLKN